MQIFEYLHNGITGKTIDVKPQFERTATKDSYDRVAKPYGNYWRMNEIRRINTKLRQKKVAFATNVAVDTSLMIVSNFVDWVTSLKYLNAKT